MDSWLALGKKTLHLGETLTVDRFKDPVKKEIRKKN